MADNSFTLQFVTDPAEMFASLTKAVKKNRGEISADQERGSFRIATALGPVSGDYEMGGQHVIITITEKPVWLAYSAIESKLRDYIK